MLNKNYIYIAGSYFFSGGCCGRDRMVVRFTTIYGFLRFPPPIKLTAMI